MQKILFTEAECIKIKQSINNSPAGSKDNLSYRRYEEFLILDGEILELVLSKTKIFGIENIREGRILKYEPGCFFNIHTDAYDKHPHRYKTLIIQLSDENDYEGGKMIFGNDILNKKIGSTAFFDSTTLHGMEIIESGIRYSFVVWLERMDLGIKKNIL